MKFFLRSLITMTALMCCSISAQAAGDCSITYNTNDELTKLIKERKFEFDNYQSICQQLRAANAVVNIANQVQISPYQTTVTLSIRLNARELENSGFDLLTWAQQWVRYDNERTTISGQNNLYELTMHALSSLDMELIKDLNKKRAALKAYKAQK